MTRPDTSFGDPPAPAPVGTRTSLAPRHSLRALLFAAFLPGVTAVAQEREFSLAVATWRLAEPRSEIVGAAALADGRVLLADRLERAIYVATADGSGVARLGRNGRGPGEYQVPSAITRARADTLYVNAGNQRYLRITGDGRIAPDLPIPTLFLQRGGLAPPRGIDATGGIYWQGDVLGTEGGRFIRSEIQNVRRWRPPSEHLDTVAALRDHPAAVHAQRFFPLQPRDLFVVTRDGRVGVLSAEPYRLRWYLDGRVVEEGPIVAHDAVPVTPAERAAYRRDRARRPGAVRVEGVGGGEPSPGALREMEDVYPDAYFPRVLPPFVENGARLSPGEDLWVVRSGPIGQRRVRIDVLASNGSRRGHLFLPAGRRLVALEASGIFLARVDDDGLEWLERYPWPSGLR